MSRTVIVALPVDDDEDIFAVHQRLTEAPDLDGEDDSLEPCVFEDVAALLNDLGLDLTPSQHALLSTSQP